MAARRLGLQKGFIEGGLALLWNKSLSVDLQSYSQNHIDVEVFCPVAKVRWRFTGFYGFPEQSRRYQSWDLLRSLNHHRDLPWIVGGDFNEILENSEKEGGNLKLPYHLEAFRVALDDCSLSDIGWVGDPFTWSNRRENPHTVRCRRDRVCANGRRASVGFTVFLL